MLDAGLPAINVCAPESLGDELFSYAGSGTLFTRERYVAVRDLGVDDFDAASDLIRRGQAEGFLAARDAAGIDALLASGFGAFVEGRDLAGIGSLLPSLDGKGAEIAGLYTLTRFLGEGVGFSLVEYAAAEAQRRGLAYVFACTGLEDVGVFFERNRFERVAPGSLPAAKWDGYDPDRLARVRCYRRALDQPRADSEK
jgi:amino-acid N-acetyltransferase